MDSFTNQMELNASHSLPHTLPSAELLIEAINDGFLLVDFEWKVTHSNLKAQQLLRRSFTDLIGSSLWSLIADDPNTMAQQQLTRAMQQQQAVELDVFYPDLFTWNEVRALPSPQGLILILRDITDRQWLIHREAEKIYLRGVFMDAPVAISVTRGPHHQFDFVNRQAQKIIGGRNVEGLTVREAFPEVAEQGFIDILDHVYQTGETYEIENRTVLLDRHGNGEIEEACFNLSYRALHGFDGKISGILNLSVEV